MITSERITGGLQKGFVMGLVGYREKTERDLKMMRETPVIK
jgi:hypothetical protein